MCTSVSFTQWMSYETSTQIKIKNLPAPPKPSTALWHSECHIKLIVLLASSISLSFIWFWTLQKWRHAVGTVLCIVFLLLSGWDPGPLLPQCHVWVWGLGSGRERSGISPGAWSPANQGLWFQGQKMGDPAQEGKGNSPFLCPFILFGPSTHWMRSPQLVRGSSLLSPLIKR